MGIQRLTASIKRGVILDLRDRFDSHVGIEYTDYSSGEEGRTIVVEKRGGLARGPSTVIPYLVPSLLWSGG